MTAITAIVVSHNSEAEIGACLDALRHRVEEVIVVDNASEDRTADAVRCRPWVDLIAESENMGFAGGANAGAKRAGGALLLLLNPDAVVGSDLGPLRAACAEHGIAAGALTDPDGRVQAGFTVRNLPTATALIFEVLGLNRLWPGNPVNRRYRRLDADLGCPGLVEQPAGAFLMIRRDAFDRLGGFDESFWPVWFEDVDFCRRALAAGYRIAYVPTVRAIHSGGHSVHRIPTGPKQLYWYGSLLKYARKSYGFLGFRVICIAVVLGSLFRGFAGIWNRGDGAPFEVYGKVMRMAAAHLFAVSPLRDRNASGRALPASRTADGG